jgi:flagellar basal-body rod modification protein FlgD
VSNTIDASLFYSNRTIDSNKTSDGLLGKDDFLKILITQLQNQDPTNPMDDREFIAQMAQFSSLEQMTNMNKTLQTFISRQADQKMFEYSHTIGKQVKVLSGYDDNNKPIYQTAVVEAISQQNDKIAIKLSDGQWVSEELIVEISKVTTNNNENPVPTEEENGMGDDNNQENEGDNETQE